MSALMLPLAMNSRSQAAKSLLGKLGGEGCRGDLNGICYVCRNLDPLSSLLRALQVAISLGSGYSFRFQYSSSGKLGIIPVWFFVIYCRVAL